MQSERRSMLDKFLEMVREGTGAFWLRLRKSIRDGIEDEEPAALKANESKGTETEKPSHGP